MSSLEKRGLFPLSRLHVQPPRSHFVYIKSCLRLEEPLALRCSFNSMRARARKALSTLHCARRCSAEFISLKRNGAAILIRLFTFRLGWPASCSAASFPLARLREANRIRGLINRERLLDTFFFYRGYLRVMYCLREFTKHDGCLRVLYNLFALIKIFYHKVVHFLIERYRFNRSFSYIY